MGAPVAVCDAYQEGADSVDSLAHMIRRHAHPGEDNETRRWCGGRTESRTVNGTVPRALSPDGRAPLPRRDGLAAHAAGSQRRGTHARAAHCKVRARSVGTVEPAVPRIRLPTQHVGRASCSEPLLFGEARYAGRGERGVERRKHVRAAEYVGGRAVQRMAESFVL